VNYILLFLPLLAEERHFQFANIWEETSFLFATVAYQRTQETCLLFVMVFLEALPVQF
jgi:hypothetical protein